MRARELVHVELERVLGRVGPRRDAGEVRGGRRRFYEECGAEHGLFVFLEPPRRLAFPTRVDFSCLGCCRGAAEDNPAPQEQRRAGHGDSGERYNALLGPVVRLPQRIRHAKWPKLFCPLAKWTY